MRTAKYDPLRHWLSSAPHPVMVTFAEVGRIVGGLPPSAFRYPEWWSNEANGKHVQARAWMALGRRVSDLDLPSQTVVFS
jgi:hypothetical protein